MQYACSQIGCITLGISLYMMAQPQAFGVYVHVNHVETSTSIYHIHVPIVQHDDSRYVLSTMYMYILSTMDSQFGLTRAKSYIK